MSRVGKSVIKVPQGVEVKIANESITVKGKLGTLSRMLHESVAIEQSSDTLEVKLKNPEAKRPNMAAWGMTRSLLNNMVMGVSQGFTKGLEIIGVGYRASVSGKTLNLNLGFSHSVEFPIPDGITIKVEKNTKIEVSGVDNALVGQVCADIRQYRPPEPYKGKGVRYTGEQVVRKEGKKK